MNVWQYTYTDELCHHGIKGQRWGVRRYQYEDGTLTAAGKKRYLNADRPLNSKKKKEISRRYEKLSEKAAADAQAKHNRLYVDSYNKAADKMNSGGIESFNKSQEEKYGANYANREGYIEDYYAVFDKELTSIYNKSLLKLYDSDKNFKKAMTLAERYSMSSWDELAKKNQEFITELRRIVDSYE